MEPAPLRLRLVAATASVVVTLVLFQCVALLGDDTHATQPLQANGAATTAHVAAKAKGVL